MATAGTIALMAANNNAALAVQRRNAQAEQVAQCKADVLPGYQHATATVSQQQQYASCVRLIHPMPVVDDPTSILVLKAVVIVLMVGTIVGTWIGAKADGLFGAFLGTLFGFAASACGLGGAGALYAACRFLLS